MDLDQLAALRTPEGSAALTAAAELAGGDPLAAASALRAAGVPPALAAAALTQAELRRRAVGKFGPAAAGMFLTRAGLEQATRRVVADRRAARLRAAGVRTLADLGLRLGADALAAARAGIRVYGVEADPVTAAMAAANAEAAGLAELFTVECGDATGVRRVSGSTRSSAIRPAAATGTGRRIFDPARLLPAVGLRHRPGRAGAAHGGQGRARASTTRCIPAGAEAEWVGVGRRPGRGRRSGAARWRRCPAAPPC